LKRKSKFVVKVSKPGFKPQETEVHGKVKGGGVAGGAGNAILGGGIGLGIDAISGAMMNLSPNPLVVNLVPEVAPVAAAVETSPAREAALAAPAPAADAATASPTADGVPAPDAAAPAPGGE